MFKTRFPKCRFSQPLMKVWTLKLYTFHSSQEVKLYCNAFPIKQYRVSLYLYTMEPTTNCNFTDKDRELLNSIARTLSVIEKDVKTIQNDIKFAHNYHEFIKNQTRYNFYVFVCVAFKRIKSRSILSK